jgi:hypothetical protein
MHPDRQVILTYKLIVAVRESLSESQPQLQDRQAVKSQSDSIVWENLACEYLFFEFVS